MLIDTGEAAPAWHPDPIETWNRWDLKADPGKIDRAAAGWRALAKAARRQAKTVDTPAQKLHDGEWRGETAETYHAHRVKLTDDVREVAGLADRIASALEAAATELSNAQRRLDTSWAALTRAAPATFGGHGVTLHPADAADVKAVDKAIEEAEEIRGYLNTQLLESNSSLAKAEREFQMLAAAWASVAAGVSSPFTLPPEAPGTGFIFDSENNRYIINTGSGNDTVTVSVDPKTGERVVVVNGVKHLVPDGAEVTVRTGAGNDTVAVPPGARVNLTLLGSDGDDTINGGAGAERVLGGSGVDRVAAGAGADRVSGGTSNDTIKSGSGNDVVTGGWGDDVIETGEGDDYASGGDGEDYLSGYRGDDSLHGDEGDDVGYAGSGNDRVTGGSGADYIDGGRGGDTLDGGSLTDVVSGGRGDDTVLGGSGPDTLIAGEGKDTVEGAGGNDQAYAEKGDATSAETVVNVEMTVDPGLIQVEGSDEFKERVLDDLNTLRSTPHGREMLAAMDDFQSDEARNGIKIVESTRGNWYVPPDRWWIEPANDPATIKYNPAQTATTSVLRPPVVGLYHEMAHAYDYGHGVTADGTYQGRDGVDRGDVSNSERQAVGLPVTDDPRAPEEMDPDHPYGLTENALREELGLPKREHYK